MVGAQQMPLRQRAQETVGGVGFIRRLQRQKRRQQRQNHDDPQHDGAETGQPIAEQKTQEQAHVSFPIMS